MLRFALIFMLACTTQAAIGQTQMPEQLRVQIEENYIGSWKFTMKSEDGVVTGTAKAKWAPGKHCVLITQVVNSPEGRVHESGILAWQPDTKTIVHHAFMSSGDYFRITYDKFEGDTWSGRVTGLVNGTRPDDSDATVIWKKNSFRYKDAIFVYEATRTANVKQE